jgi:hypothetical protein
MALSGQSSGALLLNHIAHVFFMSAKPKMVRIHTSWIIAFVEYLFSIWNRSDMQYPTSAMGFNHSPLMAGYASIAVRGSASSPNPAGISFYHLFPKALWKVCGKSLRSKVLIGNLNHVSIRCRSGYWPGGIFL